MSIIGSEEINLLRMFAEESHILIGNRLTYYAVDRINTNVNSVFSEPESYDVESSPKYKVFQVYGVWNNNTITQSIGENGLEIVKTRTIYISYLQALKSGLLKEIIIGENNVGDVIKCGDGYFTVNTCSPSGYNYQDDRPIMFVFECKRNYKFVPERQLNEEDLVNTGNPHDSSVRDSNYPSVEDIDMKFIDNDFFKIDR